MHLVFSSHHEEDEKKKKKKEGKKHGPERWGKQMRIHLYIWFRSHDVILSSMHSKNRNGEIEKRKKSLMRKTFGGPFVSLLPGA